MGAFFIIVIEGKLMRVNIIYRFRHNYELIIYRNATSYYYVVYNVANGIKVRYNSPAMAWHDILLRLKTV